MESSSIRAPHRLWSTLLNLEQERASNTSMVNCRISSKREKPWRMKLQEECKNQAIRLIPDKVLSLSPSSRSQISLQERLRPNMMTMPLISLLIESQLVAREINSPWMRSAPLRWGRGSNHPRRRVAEVLPRIYLEWMMTADIELDLKIMILVRRRVSKVQALSMTPHMILNLWCLLKVIIWESQVSDCLWVLLVYCP